MVLGARTIREHWPMSAGQEHQEEPRTFNRRRTQIYADERRQTPPRCDQIQIRVHSRFNFRLCSRPSAVSLQSGSKAYSAQRGKVLLTSVSARSNFRQFGSNCSTNRQNRIE